MKCGFSVKTKISNNQSLTVEDIKNQAASKTKCFIPFTTVNRAVLEIETTKARAEETCL